MYSGIKHGSDFLLTGLRSSVLRGLDLWALLVVNFSSLVLTGLELKKDMEKYQGPNAQFVILPCRV